MIRWSYVGSRLALLAVVWAFFAFAFDPLLKRGMAKALSSALGAKVDIGGVRTHIFPPSLQLKDFAAADSAVSAAQLDGLRWGTPRKRSGALPKVPPSAAAQKLKGWAQSHAKMPGFEGGKLAGLKDVKLDAKSLASSKLAEELEAKWKNKLDALETTVSTAAAAADLKELERLFNQAKGSGSIPDKLKSAKELLDRVQSLRQKTSSLRKELDSGLAGMRGELEILRKAKDGDLKGLAGELGLPSFDQESLTAYLLGPKAADAVTRVIHLVRTSRKAMSPAKKAPLQAARGVTVPFPKERSWPAYWLKDMRLSGTAELGGGLDFSGTARDFSTEPALVGKPAILSLSGEQGRRSFVLEAALDHTSETPKESLRLTLKSMPMQAFSVGDPASFALQVTPGNAVVSADISVKGEAISGRITLREEGISLSPSSAGGDPLLNKALSSAFSGISDIELDIVLAGTLDDPELKLNSNFGRAAADGLKKAVGAEVQGKLKALQDQVDAALQGKTAGLDNLLKTRGGGLQQRLGLNDQKLQELQDKIGRELKVPLPKFDLKKLFH